MNKVIVGLSLSLFLACGPELRAGEGERCDEAQLCGSDLECYRGFCIPESGLSDAAAGSQGSADEEENETISESATASLDGGIASASDPGSPSGDAGSSASEPKGKDAGTARDGTTVAQTSNTAPATSPAVTSTPATTPAPSTSPSTPNAPAAPTPKPTPNPPAATPPVAADSGAASAVDAGASAADAAVSVSPDAGFELPKSCTIDECCNELARGGENEGKGGGKKCGCEDPALLRTLGCVVLAPIGVLL